MSISIFGAKNTWHKNGIWWFSKMFNNTIGESTYEKLRMIHRVNASKMWYTRQQILYEIFIEAPEVANWIGAYPKVDSSHGFPFYHTYEMYRDVQENTINSDGWFGMWIVWYAVIYAAHFYYTFMFPYYWTTQSLENDEQTRMRMKDALGTCVLEELYGLQYAEAAWNPHDFHYNRLRGAFGYSHPDDPRVMHMSTFNRQHKYKEHYITEIGSEQRNMTLPGWKTQYQK